MFDHFLDNRRHHQANVVDKCSLTYLGESFPLSMVLEDLKGGKAKLHHPGPLAPSMDDDETTAAPEHPSHISPEDVAYLKTRGAFEFPPAKTLADYKTIFLERVYPLYPIVNRAEFADHFGEGKMSPILLHAICLIAATFCPMSVIHRAGFHNRHDARLQYYNRAKLLFDTGYETDKITLLQSSLLMTFWIGGPNNYWNFHSWMGTSVTIAEGLGIHRSIANASLKPTDRSLLRRLWWIVVIRDTMNSALVGRPFKINLSHCDNEALTVADFEAEARSEGFAGHPLRKSFALYQIHMARLSLILRQIVSTRFNPKPTGSAVTHLNDALQRWRNNLPVELRWNGTLNTTSIFAWCLSLVHDHHIILANLGQSSPRTSAHLVNPDTTDQDTPSSTVTAAQRVLSLFCRIVQGGMHVFMPHEAFPSLFLAEVVFWARTRSTQALVSQLAYASLTNCQMVWLSVSEAWDSSPWVKKLFDNLMANMTGNPYVNESRGETTVVQSTAMPSLDETADPSCLAEFDSLQNHPMLTSLFDTVFDDVTFETGNEQHGFQGAPVIDQFGVFS